MNKTYLTVAQIFIGIYTVLISLASFVVLFSLTIVGGVPIQGLVNLYLFGLIGLYVVIFIRFGLAKDKPRMKNEIIIWSVLLLMSSNLLAGIFGIIAALSTDDKKENLGHKTIESQLKSLDNLYDKGLISQEEYKTRRMRILDGL